MHKQKHTHTHSAINANKKNKMENKIKKSYNDINYKK